MKEKYLTKEQSICAAQIFLNAFGLILENKKLPNNNKLKIFNNENEEVGELSIQDNLVSINAFYEKTFLEAKYIIPKIVSYPSDNLEVSWQTNINFALENRERKIYGNVLFNSAINSRGIVKCSCSPSITCDVPSLGSINLEILRMGSIFSFMKRDNNSFEVIDVTLDKWPNGYILHKVENNNTNVKKGLPNLKVSLVANTEEKTKECGEIDVTTSIQYGKNKKTTSDNILYAKNIDRKKLLMEKIMIMQEIDPDMFVKLKEFKNYFMIDNISLVDNFASICFDDYSYSEVESLIKVRRRKDIYQNGAKNLVRSYFKQKDIFLPLVEDEKRLVRKKQ